MKTLIIIYFNLQKPNFVLNFLNNIIDLIKKFLFNKSLDIIIDKKIELI